MVLLPLGTCAACDGPHATPHLAELRHIVVGGSRCFPRAYETEAAWVEPLCGCCALWALGVFTTLKKVVTYSLRKTLDT